MFYRRISRISCTPGLRRLTCQREAVTAIAAALAPTRRSTRLVSWLVQQTRRLREPARKTTQKRSRAKQRRSEAGKLPAARCTRSITHTQTHTHRHRSLDFTLRSLPDSIVCSPPLYGIPLVFVRAFSACVCKRERARVFVRRGGVSGQAQMRSDNSRKVCGSLHRTAWGCSSKNLVSDKQETIGTGCPVCTYSPWGFDSALSLKHSPRRCCYGGSKSAATAYTCWSAGENSRRRRSNDTRAMSRRASLKKHSPTSTNVPETKKKSR